MSGLTPGAMAALSVALHERIDGDFLIGAERWDQSDVPMDQAGASGLVRWAAGAVEGVVTDWLKEARTDSRAKGAAEALDAVLIRGDEGIEFGPTNYLLLRRIVLDVRRKFANLADDTEADQPGRCRCPFPESCSDAGVR